MAQLTLEITNVDEPPYTVTFDGTSDQASDWIEWIFALPPDTTINLKNADEETLELLQSGEITTEPE